MRSIQSRLHDMLYRSVGGPVARLSWHTLPLRAEVDVFHAFRSLYFLLI